MKKLLFILFLAASILPSMASAAVTVSVTQSGADSGSVISGRTFTVSASGWSGSCSSAYLDLSSCGVCSVSESQTKSLSGSTASWTTVTASKANAQSISVSVSGSCTPDSGSASFDVKNPPSLSATASTSSSSVTQGSTFPLSLNFQNTGETTARFGTITFLPSHFTSSQCSPSDIAGGQSSGLTCTISASSSATTGAQTMYVYINPTNTDSLTKTISITVSSSGGGNPPSGGSSPTGGSLPPGQQKKQEKNVTVTIVPPGLLNNTKLQAAIEKVLAKGKMNQNAVDNLVRLSNTISGETEVSRTISVNVTSEVKTKIKYKGAKTAKNYVVYEKIPKSFANSSDRITVTAVGAKIEVVEKDPEYAIVFDTVSPGQEISITYSVGSAVSTGTVDSFSTEVYADSVIEPGQQVCAQVITPAKNPATGECREYATPCDVPADWTKVDSCQGQQQQGNQGTGGQKPVTGDTGKKTVPVIYYMALIAIILAVAYYYLGVRGKSSKYSV